MAGYGAPMTSPYRTLVHCFGRHLETEDWEKNMWLGDKDALGQIPSTLLVADLEQADFLSFGTGASEDKESGRKEATVIRDRGRDGLSSLADLSDFSGVNFAKLKTLLESAKLDTESKSTVAEIKCLSELCATLSISRVFCVTNPSHAPRCRRSIDEHWGPALPNHATYVVSSQVPYARTAVGDTLVYERHHRPDTKDPEYARILAPVKEFDDDTASAFAKELELLVTMHTPPS